MAFDGVVIANLKKELNDSICGKRISKIIMPEKDELVFTFKCHDYTKKLLISVNPSLPLMYLTKENKTAPMVAPAFCMLLRKHIGSGMIKSISQPGLERILVITFECRSEMGDIVIKKLHIELMGKYSNIIFTDEDDIIIDSIKRIPSYISSLREVLPGRKYFIPKELMKIDPLVIDKESFFELIHQSDKPADDILSSLLSGISYIVSSDICIRSHVDTTIPASSLDDDSIDRLYDILSQIAKDIISDNFNPMMICQSDIPVDFTSMTLSVYDSDQYEKIYYDSVSELLYDYYNKKEISSRMHQKSADLSRTLRSILERDIKKYDIQKKQLKDTEKKDKYKIYADLINTYGYDLTGDEDKLICNNYYDNDKEISIPLDNNLNPKQNAEKYYARYAKLKRTYEAISEEIIKTKSDIDHLKSMIASIDISQNEADINQIRDEAREYGYIKKISKSKIKLIEKSKPLHYMTSDGYHVYVGKNNYQNEQVTFDIASSNDWWFHAKNIPGSHVIVKTDKDMISDIACEEAAALAAYYSSGDKDSKIDIDYTKRMNLKKVPKAAPGFVIYHTNYSMTIMPRCDLKLIND